MTNVIDFDSAQEGLAASVDNYERRENQAVLAHAVERHLRHEGRGKHLIAQAGTGVGKSMGYLIPAILSPGRTVVSTATKALQDQIALKDLPLLEEHLGVPFTYAVLKGRSNYLCLAELARADADSPELAKGVRVTLKSRKDDPKFLAERDDLNVEATDWPSLSTSSADCPGRRQCPFGEECYAEKAKARAQDAKVVVVNHALFLTDLRIKEITEGAANMIGGYDSVVLDEGHEIEDYATSQWQTSIREGGMLALSADLRNFAFKVNDRPSETLIATLPALTGAVQSLWDRLPQDGRMRQGDVLVIADEIVALIDKLVEVGGIFAEIAPKDDGTPASKKLLASYRRLTKRIGNVTTNVKGIIMADFNEVVRWVETETYKGKESRVINSVPISVAHILRELLFGSDEGPVVCLVSATILVKGSADYIVGRLGIDSYDELDVGTPFNYKTQARLYVPSHLPEPTPANKVAWEGQSVTEIADLIRASDGRALILFTSIAHMKSAYDILSPRLPYKTLIQGSDTNKRLVQEFKDDVHSVLFATKSFFTGISIEGEALSLVVVTKLPFHVPTDPVHQAREEAVQKAGGNSFSGYTIPLMSLSLQQAFGRLIRHTEDSGVVAILDKRLTTKPYGKIIRKSLPDAPLLETIGEVDSFFESAVR